MGEHVSLTDRRGDTPDRRSALAPFANGKGEWLRFVVSLIVAGIVAYFTATAHVQARLSAIEATAEARHQELLRFMQRVEAYMHKDAR